MAEYIEREAAFEKCGWYNTVNGKSVCAVRKDEIAAIPAADVVEVKHGRWKSIANKPHMIYECSLCKDLWGYGSVLRMNYCPNCGARMDGE